jgi:hypothetical protein
MTGSPNMPNRMPPLGEETRDPFLTGGTASSSKQRPVEDASADDGQPKGPDAFKEAMHRLGEAREYAGYLAAAHIDKLKAKARRIAVQAALGMVGAIILLALLVSAAALVLQGVAGLIGELLGGRVWAGALITGGGFLLLTGLGTWLGLRFWQAAAFKSLQKRYEYRKRKQRAQFGHSVDPLDDLSH